MPLSVGSLNGGGTEVPIRRRKQFVARILLQRNILCPFRHEIAPIGDLGSFAKITSEPERYGAWRRESDG